MNLTPWPVKVQGTNVILPSDGHAFVANGHLFGLPDLDKGIQLIVTKEVLVFLATQHQMPNGIKRLTMDLTVVQFKSGLVPTEDGFQDLLFYQGQPVAPTVSPL